MRLFPLSRPGYLSGDTQYDDGVYFGNVARLATAVADAANVTLIGLLVRHRGSLAVTLACAGYAIYPAALIASQTLLLEPWLNLFCLLGALLVFPPGRRAGSRRLAWGGACFGFAAAIKIWAFAPALLAGLTGWGLTPLDRYVLLGAAVVTVMMFVPLGVVRALRGLRRAVRGPRGGSSCRPAARGDRAPAS